MQIFAIVGEDGYIKDIADSEEYILPGAVLLDWDNYYSFFGDEIYSCKIGKNTKKETVLLADGKEIESIYHFAELDHAKHQLEYEKKLENMQDEIPPTPQQEIETLKTENQELKDELVNVRGAVLELSDMVVDQLFG